MRKRNPAVVALRHLAIVALPFCAAMPASAAVDAEAAETLARKNGCFKCHAIEKAKGGPSYQRVAARLKTKPDAAETIIEHLTTGPLIELPDGTHEKHKIIDTKDPKELRNLAEWILSL